MSNSHEPSYYEIALTNRQVIVAFVLLLLCMVAAFFSGVWIGRESGVRSATEQMVRNTPPPEEEKKEGQNLEEFEFFDSAQKGKTGQAGKNHAETKPAEPAPETPSQAATDSTLAEDFGAEDTEAGAAPKPSAASPATPPQKTPAPEPTPAAARPVPTPRPPKKPAGKPEPSAEPARAAGQVVIQVFSSPEREQAVRIRDRLVGGGHKAYLSPVEVSGRTMYRVRIGPFASRDKAQQAAEQVRKSFKLDTWVTE